MDVFYYAKGKYKPMKIKTGFVSNSSTTSFVCCVCKEQFSGMDLTVREVEHSTCENGHIVCNDRLLPVVVKVDPDSDQGVDDDCYYEDEVTAERCPICQFKVQPPDRYILRYLLKINNITREDVFEKIKHGFATYGDFINYLK